MHALTLAIQNLDSLPDGGPLQITVRGQRGIDIGRDQYLDWTLPDPGRIVSSRHCEVRFRDGAYWLHDISSNGTFVNGSSMRLAGAHRLVQGDRIEIGHYIIGVTVEGSAVAAPPADAVADYEPAPGNFWDATSAAAPIPAAQLRPPPAAAERSDMMSWFVDIPEPTPVAPPHVAPAQAWPRSDGSFPPEPQPAPAMPAVPAPGWPPADAPVQAAAPTPFAPAPGLPAQGVPTSLSPAAPGADSNYWSIPPMPRAAAQPSVPPAPSTSAPPASMRSPPVAPVAEPVRQFAPPMTDAAAPAQASDFQLAARMARGAGVSEDVFARRSPEELAELSGLLLRLTCENLKQMLSVRAETKGLVRSTNQTMIQAIENNPLKFSPSVEDALRTMFGPTTSSYLDPRRAIEESFRDLKSHQMNTYVAMQQAMKMVMEDLDPERIETETEKEGGLGGLMGSRKAKLWDQFVTRWKAKTARHDNGLLGVFFLYFSECYDRLASKMRSN